MNSQITVFPLFRLKQHGGSNKFTLGTLHAVILGIVYSHFLLGCGGLPVKETKLPDHLDTNSVDLRSPGDSSWGTTMKQYKFSNDIVDARVDSTGSILGVLYATTNWDSHKLLLFSVPELQPTRLFTVPTHTKFMDLQLDRAILRTQDGETILFRFDSADHAVSCKGACLIQDQYLVLHNEDLTSVRENTRGDLLWQQKRDDSQPVYIFSGQDRDHSFWLNDGLWCANLPHGTIWFSKADIISKDYLRSIVGAAAYSLGYALGAAIAGGAVSAPMVPVAAPDIKIQCSNPFVENDSVYFASKDSLLCLKADDGKLLWRRKLWREDSPAYLWKLDEKVGVLIQLNSPTFIEGFNLSNGDSLWRFLPNEKYTIKDERVIDGKCYLLTDSVLYVITKQGESGANFRFNSTFSPQKMVLQDTALFVIGENQIGAWKLSSKEPLSFLWHRDTKNVRRVCVERGKYLWWVSDDDYLEVLDSGTGQIVRSTRLPLHDILAPASMVEISTKPDYLLLKSGRKFGIIQVDSLLK